MAWLNPNKWDRNQKCIDVECWNTGNRGENYIIEHAAKINGAEDGMSLFKINGI